jgi:predicted amidohydrolase YtcJ
MAPVRRQLRTRNITIDDGKIVAISPDADAVASDGTTILDLRGYSVMPGIVGMHDHIACIAQPNLAADASFEAPTRWIDVRREQVSFGA